MCLAASNRKKLRQMYTIRKYTRLRNWKPRNRAVLKAEWICFPIVVWSLLLYLQAGSKMWAAVWTSDPYMTITRGKGICLPVMVSSDQGRTFPEVPSQLFLISMDTYKYITVKLKEFIMISLDGSVPLPVWLLSREEWGTIGKKGYNVLDPYPGLAENLEVRTLNSFVEWISELPWPYLICPFQNYCIYNQHHLLVYFLIVYFLLFFGNVICVSLNNQSIGNRC